MKKQLLSMILSVMLGVSSLGYAQQAATTPEGFKYQASLRNQQGEVITDKLVSIRISILSKGTNLKGGNTEAVYSEVHTVSTNKLGMVNFEIGNGKNSIGDFSSINWGSTEHYVQIEMDEAGGDNYTILGTSQLMAVPYSLHAKMAGDVMPGSITIQNEIAARKEADEVLQSQVNIIRQLLEQKGSGKDGADFTLGLPQDLADLKERYVADSTAKSSRLNYELTRFTNDSAAKQTQITNNLTRFINDSVAKNTTINDNLTRFMNDSVAVRALISLLQDNTQAQVANNLTRFTNDSAALRNLIDAEVARATTAEEALAANLSAETTRAANTENTLDAKITAEKTRAEGIEGGLRTDLDAEVARATAAEQANATAIAAEAATARAAETGLDSRVDALEATDAAQATTNANQAATNTALQAAIDAEAATARAAEQTNTSAIAAETTRATNAENTLEAKIKTEKNRAEAAESVLNTAITSEASRAAAAETSLDSKITAEEDRATAAEAALAADIAAEATTASTATAAVQTNLDAEVSRATAAEQANAAAISAETTRAQGAESGLDTRVDALEATDAAQATTNAGLQTSIDNEVSRATAAEATLTSNLNAEISRATAAEQANANAIASEAATARAAEQTNASAIAAETARATAAEITLDGKITIEKTRAETAESALQTAVANETATARAAESGLDTRVDVLEATDAVQSTTNADLQAQITAEVDRATAVDAAQATTNTAQAANNASQASDIATNTAAITAETTRATAAENGLNASITTEKNRAETVESGLDTRVDALEATDAAQATTNTNLQAAIDAEAATARAAEQANATAIAIEASRAQAAEKTLNNNITAEQTRAEAAETALNSEIAGETTRAVAAEAGLDTRVDALEAATTTQATTNTGLQSAIDAEVSRATGIENGLQTQVTDNLTRFANDSVALRSLITTASSNLWSKSGNSSSATDFIGTTNDADLVLKTNNADRLHITSGGNIGIGTAAPHAQVQLANSVANRKLVLYEISNNDNQYYGFGINSSTLRYQSDVDHAFFTAASSTTSNEIMRLKRSGNVGIGTNNPSAKLEVAGQVKITGQAANLEVAGQVKITGPVEINTTTGSLLLPRLTTAQRDNLDAVPGMTIYNTTAQKFQGFVGVPNDNILDINNSSIANTYFNYYSLDRKGQSFTAGTTGQLTKIGLNIAYDYWGNNATYNVTLKSGTGSGATTIHSQNITISGWGNLTFPISGIVNVTSGIQYSLWFQRISGEYVDVHYNENVYGNGKMFGFYGSYYEDWSRDLAFKTFVYPTSLGEGAGWKDIPSETWLQTQITNNLTRFKNDSAAIRGLIGNNGSGWSLSGNSASATDFIGTTNAQDVVLKRNNVVSERVYTGGATVWTGDVSTGVTPVSGPGSRMMWIPNKKAFRVGQVDATQWDNASIGEHSFATGLNTTASAQFSTAIGRGTIASGHHSTAMGYYTTASSGYTTSMGVGTTASGSHSTAMGNYVSTNGMEGAFIIGDHSTTSVLSSEASNQFRARFAGGYALFTNSTTSSGVLLTANSNSWASVSDSTKKENVIIADGEEFLKKISTMRLGSWNYKDQDARTLRHYGPMAQEMFSLFGHDGIGTIGNDTTIASADIDGVIMIAIKALEKRTAELNDVKQKLSDVEQQLSKTQKEISALKAAQHETEVLKARMQKLERLLESKEVKMVMSREVDK